MTELDSQTSPVNADTDGDQLSDNDDPQPLVFNDDTDIDFDGCVRACGC